MVYYLIFSFIVLISIIFVFYVFRFNPFKVIRNIFQKLLKWVASYNTKRTINRLKRNKIIKEKRGIISKYNALAEGLIEDYNLPLTLEGFNKFVTIIFVILILTAFVLFQNMTLSILVSASMLVAAFTYFMMQSRIAESTKIEAIMDAEDLLCPLAKDGVLVAVKKVLESRDYLSPQIRQYFVQFVDNCENHGYTFKRAMEVLNRQLGPKFDNFAEKAIIFEYNERKGMADIFLDIVDENAALREINARKNRIFRQMNREFIIKSALIVLFVMYSMTGDTLRDFMLSTSLGRSITYCHLTICLSFARCQYLQRDISIKRDFKGRIMLLIARLLAIIAIIYLSFTLVFAIVKPVSNKRKKNTRDFLNQAKRQAKKERLYYIRDVVLRKFTNRMLLGELKRSEYKELISRLDLKTTPEEIRAKQIVLALLALLAALVIMQINPLIGYLSLLAQ